MGLSYRLADAPPYLQALHAERMERIRRANAMSAGACSRHVVLPTPVKAVLVQPTPIVVIMAPTPPAAHVERPAPTVHEIVRATCAHFLVSRIDILSRRRTAHVVGPRQVAMYLSRMLTALSLPSIGVYIGGKDHTSVLHAIRKIAAWRLDPSRTTDADCRAIAARLGLHLTDAPLSLEQLRSAARALYLAKRNAIQHAAAATDARDKRPDVWFLEQNGALREIEQIGKELAFITTYAADYAEWKASIISGRSAT